MLDILTLYYSIPPDFLATALFQLASWLTDPACNAHELYRLAQATENFFLYISAIGWAALAVLTTLPAIGSRALATHIQTTPFTYVPSNAPNKVLESSSFSLLSWNVCFIGGGYAISDGGLMPWSYRIGPVVDKIVETDADVNCLYETFDTKAAFQLSEKLSARGYHCYFNINPKAVGISSGIFVASKYQLSNATFTPFPQDSLVGRTKVAGKGIFSFDLTSENNRFATIHATHLQHSEEPEYPTSDEVAGRKKQMDMVMEQITTGHATIVTGDLNLDDAEYANSDWHQQFEKNDLFIEKTWGGDEFCATLMDKTFSNPLNLDHTMVVKGSAKEIRTTLVRTGYDPKVFKEEALSDHEGLLTEITLQ